LSQACVLRVNTIFWWRCAEEATALQVSPYAKPD